MWNFKLREGSFPAVWRGRGGLVSAATVMTDASLIAMRREIRAAARCWLLAAGAGHTLQLATSKQFENNHNAGRGVGLVAKYYMILAF